jgi:hypothetical protein
MAPRASLQMFRESAPRAWDDQNDARVLGLAKHGQFPCWTLPTKANFRAM